MKTNYLINFLLRNFPQAMTKEVLTAQDELFRGLQAKGRLYLDGIILGFNRKTGKIYPILNEE